MVIKEEFEILISKDGRLKITAKGFKGNKCEIPLKRLMQLIAADSRILEQGNTWEYQLSDTEATETLKLTDKDEE
jgi:hypothetical protein